MANYTNNKLQKKFPPEKTDHNFTRKKYIPLIAPDIFYF